MQVRSRQQRASGVINLDIEEYVDEPFDLIVTISTLEHVGWNRREPTAPERLRPVLDHVVSLLKPGGLLFATVPLGYNPWLDAQLAAGTLPADSVEYLRRRRRYQWTAATADEVRGARYDWPYPNANVIAILRKTRSA